MKRLAKRYPVVLYFSLACALSWVSLYSLIGLDGFLGRATLSEESVPLYYVAMCTGPFVGGLLSVYLAGGKNGLAAVFKRFGQWRVDLKYYAVAILTAPLAVLLVSFLLSFVSLRFLPAIFHSGNIMITIAGGILGGMAAGFFEEIGWTGFASDKLRSRLSVLVSGLTIGLVWGLWHFPLFMVHDPAGQVPMILLVLTLLFTHLPAFRILMTWVYDRTQSLFLAVVMHASFTASTLIFQTAVQNGVDIIVFNLTLTGLLYAAVVAVNARTKGQITRSGEPGEIQA